MSERARPETLADALSALDVLHKEYLSNWSESDAQAVATVARILRAQALEIAELHKATARLAAQVDALLTTVAAGSDVAALPDLTGSYGEYKHRTERPVPGPTPAQPLPEDLRETIHKVHEGGG